MLGDGRTAQDDQEALAPLDRRKLRLRNKWGFSRNLGGGRHTCACLASSASPLLVAGGMHTQQIYTSMVVTPSGIQYTVSRFGGPPNKGASSRNRSECLMFLDGDSSFVTVDLVIVIVVIVIKSSE